MQSIDALSLTSHLNNWVANSRSPRILHIFDHACNLINERKEILSIVTPPIGNGPFNLVLGEDVCFSEYLNLESRISSSADQLKLGDLTIHIANAQVWSPRPDWESLHANRNNVISQLTQLPFTNHQFSNSLASSLPRALADADLSSSVIAAKQMAGLGIGLTPAGDDFIMGAMYGTWIIQSHDVARLLVQEVTETAAPLTTSLSAAWLRSARRGEANILWHQFFQALIAADPNQIQEATDKILAVGETSGADALAGFISTIEARRQVD